MGLNKKQKRQLAQITARAAESKKSRKIDQENQRKRRFLRKQREEEGFWDENEDLRSESSSDESNVDESSLGERSSDKENSEVDSGGGDNTKEGLEDNNGGVELEVEGFRPVWKDGAGGYLRGVRECGSSTTEKRKRKRKRELEKSAFSTWSIVNMFSAQSKKIRSSDKGPLPTPSSAISPLKISKKKVRETSLKSQT